MHALTHPSLRSEPTVPRCNMLLDHTCLAAGHSLAPGGGGDSHLMFSDRDMAQSPSRGSFFLGMPVCISVAAQVYHRLGFQGLSRGPLANIHSSAASICCILVRGVHGGGGALQRPPGGPPLPQQACGARVLHARAAAAADRRSNRFVDERSPLEVPCEPNNSSGAFWPLFWELLDYCRIYLLEQF